MVWYNLACLSLTTFYLSTFEWTGCAARDCSEGWTMINGTCYYYIQNVALDTVVDRCEELTPLGRLFDPYDLDEAILVASQFDRPILLGSEIVGSTWNWKSGETVTANCASMIDNFGGLARLAITDALGMICLAAGTASHYNIVCKEVLIKLESNNTIYQNLTDGKVSTCIDHNDFYKKKVSNHQEAYTVDLTIITKLDGGLVTAHFDQDVNCTLRNPIAYNLPGARCSTLHHCLAETTTELSSTCRYDCPCDGDGCTVMVLEMKKVTDAQAGQLCEVTYGNSTEA